MADSEQITAMALLDCAFQPAWLDGSGLERVGGSGPALMLSSDGVQVAVIAVPRRIPDADLADAVPRSIFFQGAAHAAEAHSAHVIVSAQAISGDPATAHQAALAVSRVLRAIPSLGVLWVPSGSIVAAGQFAAASGELSEGGWPLDLWISARLFGETIGGKPSYGAASVGARPFLGYELAARPNAGSTAEAQVQLLFGVITWLCTSGKELCDGETLSIEDGQAYRATFMKAGAGEVDVMALDPVAKH